MWVPWGAVVLLLYQSSSTLSVPVTNCQQPFNIPPPPPPDISLNAPRDTAPQNVRMSLSIEPGTGPSATPCLASISVSPLLLMDDIDTPMMIPSAPLTSFVYPTVPLPFTEGVYPALSSLPPVGAAFLDSVPGTTTFQRNPCNTVPKESDLPISLPFTEKSRSKIDYPDLIPLVETSSIIPTSIPVIESLSYNIPNVDELAQVVPVINRPLGSAVPNRDLQINEYNFQNPNSGIYNPVYNEEMVPILIYNLPLPPDKFLDQVSIPVYTNVNNYISNNNGIPHIPSAQENVRKSSTQGTLNSVALSRPIDILPPISTGNTISFSAPDLTYSLPPNQCLNNDMVISSFPKNPSSSLTCLQSLGSTPTDRLTKPNLKSSDIYKNALHESYIMASEKTANSNQVIIDAAQQSVPTSFDLSSNLPLPLTILPGKLPGDVKNNQYSDSFINDIVSNPKNILSAQSVKQLDIHEVLSILPTVQSQGVFATEDFLYSKIPKIYPRFPINSIPPFNLSPPPIRSPTCLPKPSVKSSFARLSKSTLSHLLPLLESPNSLCTSSVPCITSITINFISYPQEEISEVIIII